MAATLFSVPSWWLPAVQAFWDRAYDIGLDLQVTVTSWQRTMSHNLAVGGAPASQHLVGTAWDVSGPDQDTYAARAAQRGLTVVDEGDHVHVQLYPAGVVPQWVFNQVAV